MARALRDLERAINKGIENKGNHEKKQTTTGGESAWVSRGEFGTVI